MRIVTLHRRHACLLEFCPICLLQGGDVSVDFVPRGALGIRELTHEAERDVEATITSDGDALTVTGTDLRDVTSSVVSSSDNAGSFVFHSAMSTTRMHTNTRFAIAGTRNEFALRLYGRPYQSATLTRSSRNDLMKQARPSLDLKVKKLGSLVYRIRPRLKREGFQVFSRKSGTPLRQFKEAWSELSFMACRKDRRPVRLEMLHNESAASLFQDEQFPEYMKCGGRWKTPNPRLGDPQGECTRPLHLLRFLEPLRTVSLVRSMPIRLFVAMRYTERRLTTLHQPHDFQTGMPHCNCQRVFSSTVPVMWVGLFFAYHHHHHHHHHQ
jgi:hypothetical protein